MAADHFVHAKRQADSHNGGQSLRDGRNRQADRDDEDVSYFLYIPLKIGEGCDKQVANICVIDQGHHKNNRNQDKAYQ